MQRAPVYKISLVRDGSVNYEETATSSAGVAQILRNYIGNTDREHFVVIMLNQKNKVIGINTVSVGTLAETLVHPREVFKPAILCNAAAIVCGHNHPSGDPTPSQADHSVTTRLYTAGSLLGIRVLDHVIIGDGHWYHSFADNNLMKQS